MEVTFITTELTCGQNGYGINFKGSSPVIIDTVQPSSPAEHGGLRYGDMLVELNGNDIFSFSKESLISTIRTCNRSTLRVKVGRVRPIPVTADARKEAARLVKRKLESGTTQNSGDVKQYQNQLNDSMAEVADLLKSFDLPLPTPIRQPQPSSIANKSSEGRAIQELEVELYDQEDNLPSPPSSNSSECDPADKDPLLDFTKDDHLTYKSGSSRTQVATQATPSSWQPDGSEAPQLMKATMDLKRGLNNLKGILESAGRTYEEKQNKRRIELEAASAESRQAMTTASFSQDQQRIGESRRGEEHGGRIRAAAAPPPAREQRREIRSPPREVVAPSESSSGSRVYNVADQNVTSPTRKPPSFPAKAPPSPAKVPPSPTKVLPSPAEVPPSPTKSTSPHATSGGSSLTKSHFTPPPPPAAATTTIPAISAASTVSRQSTKPQPPVPPPPYATKVQPAPVGSSEYLSRLGKIQSPETNREPWDETTKRSERDWTVKQTPPLQNSLAANSQVNVLKVASPSHGSSTGNSRSPSTSPPPPPVPSYNPSQPDSFLLSNQREYLREQVETRRSAEEPRHQGTARGSFDVQRKMEVLSPARKLVLEVAPLETACSGLPESVSDWSQEEVLLWLLQLSPALSDLYGNTFSRHCIIGRSLLRLSMAKLKKMDINSKHSTQLANEIVNLKIRQEKLELEELASQNELSYL